MNRILFINVLVVLLSKRTDIFINQPRPQAPMVTRIGTKQRKTRHKNQHSYKTRGKVSLSKYFQEFQDGDKVCLKTHPSIQKGRFFPRFHGITGTVAGKKGECYGVTIRHGSKQKLLYVHPIHLKKQ